MAHVEWTLESCAQFTRGGGPPTPDHDASDAARSARVNAEETRLIQWARAHGRIAARLPPEFARGGEHQVFFHRRQKRYFKATLPHKHRGYGIALSAFIHGATPSEYLDRLILQNAIFSDDIRLEWVSAFDAKPVIVTSQPAIRGIPAEPKAIDAMMVGKGYQRLTEGAYYDDREGLLIYDMAPRNALLGSKGVIFPIDPVIQRITAEFAEFLRCHPEAINRRN